MDPTLTSQYSSTSSFDGGSTSLTSIMFKIELARIEELKDEIEELVSKIKAANEAGGASQLHIIQLQALLNKWENAVSLGDFTSFRDGLKTIVQSLR